MLRQRGETRIHAKFYKDPTVSHDFTAQAITVHICVRKEWHLSSAISKWLELLQKNELRLGPMRRGPPRTFASQTTSLQISKIILILYKMITHYKSIRLLKSHAQCKQIRNSSNYLLHTEASNVCGLQPLWPLGMGRPYPVLSLSIYNKYYSSH